jgi:hypothetical protein
MKTSTEKSISPPTSLREKLQAISPNKKVQLAILLKMKAQLEKKS